MTNGPEEQEISPEISKEEQALSRREQPPAADADTAAFEAELRAALRPFEPPAGFAERVLATAAKDEASGKANDEGELQTARRAKVLPFRSWRVAVGSALAACLVAGAFGTQELHHRRERQRERATANQQFETATRITDQALAHTRAQLERAGVF